MKLYAKVQSERASKGQGGNEYLNITILRKVNGQNVPVYFLGVYEGEMVLTNAQNEVVLWRESDRTKGEKQKGECPDCGGALEKPASISLVAPRVL